MQITDDDFKLLIYLMEMKYIKNSRINKYIWENKSYKLANRRINTLEKNGFIKKINDPDPKAHYKTYLLSITEKGIILIDNSIEEVKKIRKKFNLADIPFGYFDEPKDEVSFRDYWHNRELNLIRFKMEEVKQNRWLPENYLKKVMYGWDKPTKKKIKNISRHLTDGIILRNNDTSIAIEYERSVKNNSRYSEIFASLEMDDFGSILYILKGKRTKSHFIRYFRKNYSLDYKGIDLPINTSRFYFIDYENLINEDENNLVYQLSSQVNYDDDNRVIMENRIINQQYLDEFLK